VHFLEYQGRCAIQNIVLKCLNAGRVTTDVDPVSANKKAHIIEIIYGFETSKRLLSRVISLA